MNLLMSLLRNVQAENIRWSHRLNHAGQDEDKQIVLLQREALTNKLIDFVIIDEWRYSERGPNNIRLPPAILYEVHIAEDLLTKAQANKVAAIRHGKQVYEIVQITPDEPGIFPPHATYRFWRLRIAPLEELP